MTEQDWLVASNAIPMVAFLRDRTSGRKLRLIACACCRQIWDRLTDLRSRRAVEVAERFADGAAPPTELRVAYTEADQAAVEAAGVSGMRWANALAAAQTGASDVTNLMTGDHGIIAFTSRRAKAGRRAAQCAVVRDIVGPLPFRPVSLDPAWLTSDVLALARGIYDDKAFDRMPILADALQDAGCDNDDVLTHCRGDGPHARGCWAVDLLLGKA